MSLAKPGLGYLRQAEAVGPESHVRSETYKEQTNDAKQWTRDLIQCGRGAVEVTAAIMMSEGVVTVPLSVALAFSGMKNIEQGCLVGLLCDALSKTNKENDECHKAADFIDPNKVAGYLLGAIGTGSDRWGETTGNLFAGLGDLGEGVTRLAEGDYLGAAEKAESLRQHAKDFLDSISNDSSKEQTKGDGNAEDQTSAEKPGQGELEDWDRIGGGPGDAGSIDYGDAVA